MSTSPDLSTYIDDNYRRLTDRSFTFSIPSQNINDFITPAVGFWMLTNMILGEGPSLAPMYFHNIGAIPGTILLFLTMIFAYMTSSFLVESLSICNALEYEGNRVTRGLPAKSEDIPYSLRKAFQFTRMSELMLGRIGKFFTVVSLTVLMLGAIAIRCLAAAKSLSVTLDYITSSELSDENRQNILLPFLLIACFYLVFVYSRRRIQTTASLHTRFGLLRLILLILMLWVTLSSIKQIGVPIIDYHFLWGKWNNNFIQESVFLFDAFSAFVFFFMVHHSIPMLSWPVRPEKGLKKAQIAAFFYSFLWLLALSMTAQLAFGDETASCKLTFPCQLQTLYNLTFWKARFFGPIINFYPFLNLIPVPLITIALRDNLVNQFQPRKLEEGGLNPREKIWWSLGILIPALIVSLMNQHNLETLISGVGRIGGICIMFFIPSLIVLEARKLRSVHLEKQENLHASPFSSNFFPLIVFLLGLGWLIFRGISYFI